MGERFDMAAISGAQRNYDVAVYVQAHEPLQPSNLHWCDINKRSGATGADVWSKRVLRNPTIRRLTEIRPGRTRSESSPLIVRNDDSQFTKSLPWTLYAADGTECELITWYRAKVRIKLKHHVGSADAWVEETVATFLIDDIQPNPNQTATITFVGPERLLMDVKAKDIREGDAWLVNIPAPLLAKRLVEIGSRGRLGIDETAWPDSCHTTGTKYKMFSPVGTIPSKDSNGEWNGSTDFVCRHKIVSPNDADVVFLVGYSKTMNSPAVVRWDRSTNAWVGPVTYEAPSREP